MQIFPTASFVRSAFNSGKRTLICSNTNKAVDQVLYKICETLTPEHPAMAEGKVVRLGRVADDKLASKYRKYVELDEITESAAIRWETVLRDANIVGATCARTYLTEAIGQFDLVIVDEASMVIRPEVWFSAGLARERVVISGDFRQIPPIVQTDEEAILQALGLDSFTATKRTKPDASGLKMLTTQYRMHPDICGLISEPMYEGKLRTAPARKKVLGRLPPNPFENPLTIIDTSDLRPVEGRDKGSRFNKCHALLVKNFVLHLRRSGVIQTNRDLGICTPYVAQARQIQALLKEDRSDNLVHCGTVHRFQGDERRIVLLEIPESGGRRALGQFVQGVPPDHEGARLISVAVSRAQEHFVVLANLDHLDKRLPSRSLLRSVLHKMEQQGRVVPGGELDKLHPIGSGPTYLPPASSSKPPSEPPSPSKAPVEHLRSTNPPAEVIMNNAPSPFGLPLEAGPLQGIDLGEPSNVIGGILYEYRVYNPPNPHPLFDFYRVSVHDELGILKIVAFGKANKNDKYGNAVRGTFDRVVKSLDRKYGANLRHIVNESVSGDLSGIAQTFDYLKSSQ